ncbi:glycosyltransferase family 4 protein [Sphingobium sp. WCS2017Hpa-17]|uniref:glycosyltransferase family 4 protein n=1 Tax=Sphingobium sp. WCS2017Hpa-17 TaxID=3073638 RepID=UPI00288A929A|nr:glycosyltransferase family 4 protein [Sphingobium sp. WCS2017Hpa-17]
MTPRIAIACPGVGLVQRGFERLFLDLFDEMRGDFPMTLFKGGGEVRAGEVVLPFLRRGGTAIRYLPLHRLMGRTPMHAECLTFALALLPHLIGGRYDVVHVIDPPLARLLFHLRRVLHLRFGLLYTEGTAMPPRDYPPCDRLHQISAATFADAVAQGHDPAHMALVPCGYRPDRFVASADRATLRAHHGIAPDRFVILSVAALNRGHKRTHHLVDEVAQMPGDPLLWLDGSLDHGDPDLPAYARAKLGDRVRVTHVPSAQVADLFALADVMPHAATFEAFGLAIVEAAAAGLPVILHDAPHFRWLLPNSACWIDMTAPGALATLLTRIAADPAERHRRQMQDHARATYDWAALRPAYADLYRSMMP